MDKWMLNDIAGICIKMSRFSWISHIKRPMSRIVDPRTVHFRQISRDFVRISCEKPTKSRKTLTI